MTTRLTTSLEPLYRRVLGSRYDRLPAPLRRLHDGRAASDFNGRCDIAGGASWPARVLARLMSLPLPAREAVENGRYTFDVRAELPVVGLLVHYRGWLE